MYKKILIFTCYALITACSSNGGSVSQPIAETNQAITQQNTVFTLFDKNFARPGTKEAFNLTGRDKTGRLITGTVSVADRGLTTFNSQSVRQTDYIMSLTASNGRFATITGTNYGNPTTRAGLFTTLASGVNCTATSSVAVPDTAKPGDFGSLSSFTCSDGTTSSGSWRLEASVNGLARIIYSSTKQDQLGEFKSAGEETFTIDTNGNVKAVLLKYRDRSGFEMTLKGS